MFNYLCPYLFEHLFKYPFFFLFIPTSIIQDYFICLLKYYITIMCLL